jgi:hypothetical protein
MLLCRSPLLPGESLPSLVARLTKLNRYDSSTMLDRLCLVDLPGQRVGHPIQPVIFERMANLTQIDPVQIYQATRHYFTPILTPPGVDTRILTLPGGEMAPLLPQRQAGMQLRPDTAAQFCPYCLQEVAYHRLIWIPMTVAVCLKHHCLLAQNCPDCHQTLSIQDIVNTQCRHCEADLRQTPPLSLGNDPMGLFAQQVLQAWLTRAETPKVVGLKLPEQPAQTLFHLVAGLSSSMLKVKDDWKYLHQVDFTPSAFSSRNTSSNQMSPLKSYISHATAFKVVTNWPTGFYEFLQAYRGCYDQNLNQGLRTDLGYLYNACVQKRWQHPSFQFVQEAFEQFLVDHYSHSITVTRSRRYRNNPAFARKFAFMPVAEAAQLLDTVPSLVYGLIETGELTAYEAQEPSNLFPFVKRADVLAVGQKKGVFLSLTQAAQQLGVSPKVVMDMAKIGLLQAVSTPEIDGWLVTQKSIKRYVWALADHVIDAVLERPPNSTIDLTTAAQVLSEVGLKEADILKSILDGNLKSYCYQLYPQNSGKLLFTKSNIRAYLRKVKTKKTKHPNEVGKFN